MSWVPDCPLSLPVPARAGHLGSGTHRLLDLAVSLGPLSRAAVALVDSGASHNFVSEAVALEAGLPIDRAIAPLSVRLADGQLRASCGAITCRVAFSATVSHMCTFYVVPLAMDCILGMPWLRATRPAIDWDT